MCRKAEERGHNLGRLVRWLVAIVVSGTAAWLAVRQIRWSGLAALLADASLPMVAISLGIILATTGVKAARWQLLLRHSGIHVGGWLTFRALVIGQMGNSFLPARLGDIARAAVVASRTVEATPTAFGTVIAEKMLDGAAGVLVVLAVAALFQIPGWLRGPILAMTIALAVLVTLAAIAFFWPRGVPSAVTTRLLRAGVKRRIEARASGARWRWLREGMSRFRQGLGALAAPPALLGGLGLSVVIWGLGAATNQVMLRATDTRAPLWANLLVLVAVYAATFLPAVPAQIGIFEYACVLALGTAGTPPDRALAFGLLLHLVVYAPPALLGSVFTAFEGLRWTGVGPDGKRPLHG